jgi:porin
MSSLDLTAPIRVGGWLSCAVLTILPAGAVAQTWPPDIHFASTEKSAEAAESTPVDDTTESAALEDESDTLDCPRSNYYYYQPSMCDELKCCMTSRLKSMAAQGITYGFGATQFYQGVASGGVDEEFEYGGKIDQFFIFDSDKLGLWDGMTMTMHVESRLGEDVNREAVGFAPVNVAMLYPKADEHDTAITNLSFDQDLGNEIHFSFGKFNALDMFYAMYPQTGRGINGFMNASMVVPLGAARVFPLSFMGVGLTKYQGKKAQSGITVFDNQDVSTTSGFDDMFQNGANIFGFWRYFTDVNGLPGSHLFGGIGATGEYVSFDPLSFVILPGEGVVFDRQGGAYSLLYIFEQTIWADNCNKNRNVGVLSQWTVSDEATSPFSWTGNVGLQAQGFNRHRPHDSMGIGWFHSALSDDFVSALSPAFTLDDVDGIELYYNAAISKMFHLTADFQVIEPADVTNDTAFVVGLRATIGM